MSRLIDADKLHSEFMKMSEFKLNSEIGEPTCGCTRRLVFHISEGIRKINEQPTVDAEPIVRCKDCKYGSRDPYNNNMRPIWCISWDHYGKEMDFCSRGERK